MDEKLSELFDLYLEDIKDSKDSIPSEFIVSSKIIFISNAKTLPSRVKDHTLSFVLDSPEEESRRSLETKNLEILKRVVSVDIDNNLASTVLDDFKSHQKSELSDYLKMLVIQGSGLPQAQIEQWIMGQE